MKVLVLWAASSQNGNYGVRVLADGMSSIARSAWGDSVEVELQDFGPEASDVSFGKKSIAREALRLGTPISDRLRLFDLILDSGAGDSFTDRYGLKRLVQMVFVQRRAFKLGIPVIMGPQTIGPFETRVGRWLARGNLRRMSMVVVRDPASAQAAAALGRPADVTATDVVFALPTERPTKIHDVVLNVSGLLWPKNNHVDNAQYEQQIVRLIDRLTGAGRRVTCMAHVVGPNVPLGDPRAADNDVPALAELRRRYSGNPRIDFLVPSSLAEARRALGAAHVVVASRMHACLNALSMGTPAVALAYSRKFAPLMDALGWDAVIDLRSTPVFADDLVDQLSDPLRMASLVDAVDPMIHRADALLDSAIVSLREFKHAE